MPRSSRHKSSSHKEAKHSSRDNREQSESESDVKTTKSSSVRVSRVSASSEKRKVSSGYSNGDASEEYGGSKRRKEKPAASDRWNGGEDEVCDVVTVDKEIKGENLKVEAVKSLKSKALVDLKSKASKRSDSGSEKKLEDVGLVVVKEESGRSSSRVESKRKSEKDTAKKEVHNEKDSKERSTGRERKIQQGNKYESEAEVEVGSKDLGDQRKGKRSRENTETSAQVESQNSELEKEPGKRIRRRRDDSDDREKDNKDDKSQGYVKESGDIRLSSKAERIKDGRSKDVKHGEKHSEDIEYVKDSEALLLSSKGERTKDGRYKDVKHGDKPREDMVDVKDSEDIRLSSKGESTKDGRYKDVKHGEKPREDIEDVKDSEDIRLSSKGENTKDRRYKDMKHGEKHPEDIEDVKESEEIRPSSKGEHTKDGRYKDVKHGEKHREDVGKDTSRDYKYREDSERYGRHRDVKYREDGDRNIKPKDDKNHEITERDDRYRDDKYREDGDRGNRHRDDKYREDGDKAYRHRGDRYRDDGDRRDRRRDDGDRDDRRRDDQYFEDGRKKEEKNWDEVGRDGGHRDDKPRNDFGKDKRLQDAKYRDERSSRDHTSDKPDIKSSRDESNAAEPHFRKSSIHDASQIYDDRRSRYNDDKGRRRTGDREDHTDMRSRSTKEQPSDAAKFSMSSSRTEPLSDRGRSRALNADIEMNHIRRRSSPDTGPHSVKDQYRNMKLEESKSRDYASEERYRHYTTPRKDLSGPTRSIEKSFQKDDSHLRDLSERRSKADSRRSPFHVPDRSPSSMSAERRHLNRSDVKRSLDTDNSGQRDGGSKDGNDYSSREGKGSREFHKETFPGDEFAQADGDTLSVSSPFGRPGHLSGNSKSFLLPGPHFRMGADSPLPLGSYEEDNRGKSNNRHRRNSDPTMGRLPGNAWRGVPNWPSPVANGFLPFQHGPPPVGFHPMMQPFPTPMFGVRPSMELNPPGFPYHVNDGDRYSGHGRPFGWHNPADDSGGPAIHGWDANNMGFRDESHNYPRSNWDHKRSFSGGDTWMGQINGGTELPSALQKDDYSSPRGADEPWTAQSDMKEQSGKKQVDGNIDIDQAGKSPERNDLGSPEIVPDEVADILRKENACPSHVYLSMLDISEDLTQPELFSQFTSLMSIDQKTGYEDDDSKLFLVEEFAGTALKNSYANSSASLFPAIDDSISQKAMSLYKKLREETRICREDSFSKDKNLEAVQILGQDGAVVGSLDEEMLAACDQTEVEEGTHPISDAVKMETSLPTSPKKIGEPIQEANNMEESDSPIAASGEDGKMELDTEVNMESSSSDHNLANKFSGNVGACDADTKFENCVVDDSEQKKLNDDKRGPLLLSGVSSSTTNTNMMACEAVMPELIEAGSVNLSRIHQSPPPESTH